MNDQDLERLQEELYKEAIEVPEEQERIVIDTADHVAKQLYFGVNKVVKVEFFDHKYSIVMRRELIKFKDTILLVVTDTNSINPKTNMPRIFKVKAEIETNLSTLECIRGTVAAFLRDQIGTLRADLIDTE